ncbi:MAG: hypothetical protein U0X73_12925 [Thermoanaerobaculia bacterium]
MRRAATMGLLAWLTATAVVAQTPVVPPAAPDQTPSAPDSIAPQAAPSAPPAEPPATPAAVPENPPSPSSAAVPNPAGASRALLPQLDIYFPEGDLDIRLSRIIKTTFFQGQVRYNFVKGDISAFLRYRFYGFDRIFQLGVFDEIKFERLEKRSNDFERVRGGLLLLEKPLSYARRFFVLGEVDRISSNKETLQFSTDRTNTFLRVGYQIGTPEDNRSNALVGESRAAIRRLFTPYRQIGPSGVGLTGALTWGFDTVGGDFDYVKGELEGLKRWQLEGDHFLFTRLHLGTFLAKDTVRPEEEDPADRYSIPRSEFFHLDGRDNLKGLDDDRLGTQEVHSTVEYFLPWFVDDARRFARLDWETWYWIVYAGVGNAGYRPKIYGAWGDYLLDVGIGFEASFRLRQFTFFWSGVVAQVTNSSGGVVVKFSIKSSQ